MKYIYISTLTIIILLSTSFHITAQVDESNIIYAMEDAYIRNGASAGTNYGEDVQLAVKKDVAGYQRESLLKFDFTDVDINKVAKINLELIATILDATMNLTSWEIGYCSNDNWSESTVTFNNAPAFETSLVTIPAIQVTGNDEMAVFELNDILNQLITEDDKIVTLRIRSTFQGQSTYAGFKSIETGLETSPKMILTLDTPLAIDENVWSMDEVSSELINVQIVDILGRVINQTTKDKFSTATLKNGNYIIIETANINGTMRKKCTKINVMN